MKESAVRPQPVAIGVAACSSLTGAWGCRQNLAPASTTALKREAGS